MTKLNRNAIALCVALAFGPQKVHAFDSQSDGSNGDLTPTVNTVVELPSSGVLQYRRVDIPGGVTVRFKRNSANTPVVLLVQQDANITGAIDVSGSSAPATGAAGNGNVGDDGLPGTGGPGGFDGGRSGSYGLGPGGGGAGQFINNVCYCGGSGGGFSGAGGADNFNRVPGGAAYGSATLLPLIGGSGGGGGFGPDQATRGSGGGGGGGAILIAASGTVRVDGAIYATGGNSGYTNATNTSAGGGGAGGAIRIVATTIAGSGTLTASAGAAGDNQWNSNYRAGNGSVGRIRLEAENFTRTNTTTPEYSFAPPGALFLAGAPQLRIARVAGVNPPAAPTGAADILLPSNLTNPVTVVFETSGVPVGTTAVKLVVTPYNAPPITTTSTPLSGDTTLATASASVTLPPGPSVLIATTSYQISAALGAALSRYANNEQVDSVRLTAALGAPATATLVTVSGKEYQVPLATFAAFAGS
jgi:hypothetical protein